VAPSSVTIHSGLRGRQWPARPMYQISPMVSTRLRHNRRLWSSIYRDSLFLAPNMLKVEGYCSATLQDGSLPPMVICCFIVPMNRL